MAYHLDALRRIHIYVIKTIFRDNFLGVPESQRPSANVYAVDTEYVNGADVYEIGIVCLGDPYASICAVIKHPDIKTMPDDMRIARTGLTNETFTKVAIDFDALLDRFLENYCKETEVFYFSAKPDINWLSGSGVSIIDVAAAAATMTPKKGTFMTESRASSLDALYGMYIGPIEDSGRHRAFPDAIMLSDIIRAMYSE